jgi:16S rRNA (cytidine1402-2'-O)-methyltransferase
MGTLYLVPTPIGNLEDITLRALRVLREAALIAAEDTRTTRTLLGHYGIGTPCTSYHEHNKLGKLDAIFAALETGDVALVSDAGTPGISDPGWELVQAAIARGITVTPLPGANAAITALVASGLSPESFIFLGFAPRKDKARRDLLARLAHVERTLIFYESPHRLADLLASIAETLPGRRVCVARELTKIYEEFVRGSAEDVLAHYQANPPRGEIVVLIAGFTPAAPEIWDEAAVRGRIRALLESGASVRDAASQVAGESAWDRGDVYALAVQEKNTR